MIPKNKRYQIRTTKALEAELVDSGVYLDCVFKNESKFLTCKEFNLYLLRQWRDSSKLANEIIEGIGKWESFTFTSI